MLHFSTDDWWQIAEAWPLEATYQGHVAAPCDLPLAWTCSVVDYEFTGAPTFCSEDRGPFALFRECLDFSASRQ